MTMFLAKIELVEATSGVRLNDPNWNELKKMMLQMRLQLLRAERMIQAMTPIVNDSVDVRAIALKRRM
jgi:hypothetical protein